MGIIELKSILSHNANIITHILYNSTNNSDYELGILTNNIAVNIGSLFIELLVSCKLLQYYETGRDTFVIIKAEWHQNLLISRSYIKPTLTEGKHFRIQQHKIDDFCFFFKR